jgi:hypothetical protein
MYLIYSFNKIKFRKIINKGESWKMKLEAGNCGDGIH